MENEDNTLDTQEVNQEGGTDAVEETADGEVSEESQGEEAETDKARLAKAESEAAKYRRLFEKTQKPKVAAPLKQASTPQLNVEETVLLANGMPEELLNELKVVAQVRRTTLIKAQTDPIFIAVKDKFEKDQKRESASLSASRGSGASKVLKDFNTPGLTREEHRKMVLDSNL